MSAVIFQFFYKLIILREAYFTSVNALNSYLRPDFYKIYTDIMQSSLNNIWLALCKLILSSVVVLFETAFCFKAQYLQPFATRLTYATLLAE